MLSVDSDSSLPEDELESRDLHTSKVLSLLNEHRLQNTKLCDIQLRINNELIPVHRSVLAACSPYFLAMFNGDMKESKQSIVDLKDVNLKIIELIITYAYTGELEINTDNAESILEHATLLQFCEVRKICCQFLKKQLDPVNCVGIRRFAALHHCKSFLNVVDDFMRHHFIDVVSSEEYTSLPFEVLKSLISSDELNIDCEERVYIGIIKWVKYNVNEREQYLYDLLSETRLPLLSINFILKYLDHEELIKNCLKCRDLLDESKNYYIQNQLYGSGVRSVRTLPRHSVSGTLVAVGGKEAGETITNKCESYNLYDNEWTSIAPLNRQRQQLGVCEVDGHVFAIGGSDGLHRLDSVEIYSQEKNIWEIGTPLQTCRSGVGVGMLGDIIYALGGYDGRYCLNSVERFDKGTETWEYITPITITRSFPGVVSLYGRLYVIGGNDGTTFLGSCESYDPMTGKWSYLTPMNSPRAGVGCAVLDGILYVAGGFDGNKRLDQVEMYEPRMNAWETITSMNSYRDGVCMASFGGYLYAIGGIDGPSYLSSVEYYDPNTNEWTDTTPMETSRAASGIAVVTNSIVVEI